MWENAHWNWSNTSIMNGQRRGVVYHITMNTTSETVINHQIYLRHNQCINSSMCVYEYHLNRFFQLLHLSCSQLILWLLQYPAIMSVSSGGTKANMYFHYFTFYSSIIRCLWGCSKSVYWNRCYYDKNKNNQNDK